MSKLLSLAPYRVTVRRLQGAAVDLQVVRTDPYAATVTDSPFFALLLVYDPIDERDYRHKPMVCNSPLATEMDYSQYVNADWVRRNAGAFVADVWVSDDQNHPIKHNSTMDTRYDVCTRSSFILHVTMTHAAWAEHLRVGMQWNTAAYPARAEQYIGPARHPPSKWSTWALRSRTYS